MKGLYRVGTVETWTVSDNRVVTCRVEAGGSGDVGVKPPGNAVRLDGLVEGHTEAPVLTERWAPPVGPSKAQ